MYTAVLFLISVYDFRNMVVLDTFLYFGLISSFIGEGLIYLINNNFINGTINYSLTENYHLFLGNYSSFINP